MAQAHGSSNVLQAERAHEELLRIACERAKLDRHEAHWLMVAYRTQANRLLGIASFAEYSERVLGHTPRVPEERLRVARALQDLPALAEALETGSLCWTAVREVTRVATPETERQWLAAAHHRTVREIERMVSGLPRGAEPGDRKDPEAQKHALHLNVRPETLALFREAADRLRREAGEVLDDDALLLAMARRILGGPEDPGRANYQVAVTVCSSCGQGSIDAAGEAIPVAPHVVSMANCDAQRLDLRPHGVKPRAPRKTFHPRCGAWSGGGIGAASFRGAETAIAISIISARVRRESIIAPQIWCSCVARTIEPFTRAGSSLTAP